MEKFLILVFVAMLLVSCSSDKSCRYEEKYNKAASALKTELDKSTDLNSELKGSKFGSDYVSDITHLSCSDFQREFKLTDKQLLEKISEVEKLADFLRTFGNTGEYILMLNLKLKSKNGKDPIDSADSFKFEFMQFRQNLQV